jgi:hypothetical protein
MPSDTAADAPRRRHRRRRLPPVEPTIALGYTPPPTVLGLRPAQWLQALGLAAVTLLLAGGFVIALVQAAA